MARRTDTRDRILSVGLRLFAEQGYANTSLREIAEELGVTKAALYFHYRTKEEIITGILRGYIDDIDALLADVRGGPATLAEREQVVRRFAQLQASWGGNLTRMIRQNFTEIGVLPVGAEVKESHRRMIEFLAGPEPTILDQTRAVAALAAIQSAQFTAKLDGAPDDADAPARRAAALTVALEVLRAGG